jgi:hypothetical protein
MANEFVSHLSPGGAVPGVGGHPTYPVPAGLALGLAFGPGGLPEPFTVTPEAAYWLTFVPAVAPLGTGFTAVLNLVDDPNAPFGGGTATFDIEYALFVSGTSVPNDALFAGTVDSGQVTMPAVTGKTTQLTITSVIAHASGAVAADTWVFVRVRRKPGTTDTHTGRILLLGASLRST